jgi:disulfide bond formation protein DsbB
MKVCSKSMIIGLLLMAVLLLAACGGKSKTANADSNTSDNNAAPAAVSEAQAGSETQGDPAKGEKVYQATCVACHGPDAKGVTGLGKSLHPVDSEFIHDLGDEELVQFIKAGRQPGDPLNTTGVAMPPKGGNPAISDDDLFHIVAWIRTLE